MLAFVSVVSQELTAACLGLLAAGVSFGFLVVAKALDRAA